MFGIQTNQEHLGQFFLLVNSQEFFSDFGSVGEENKIKKSSENDKLTGLFQSFFIFVNISRKKKTVKLER